MLLNKSANSAATKVQPDTEEVDDNDKMPQVDGTVDEIVSYDLARVDLTADEAVSNCKIYPEVFDLFSPDLCDLWGF